MTYEQMEPGSENILFVYIIITVFSIIMTVLLYLKAKERQKKATKLMFLTFLSYTLAIIVLLIGYLEMYITTYKMGIYKFSLAFAYVAIIVSNMILITFAAEIFSFEKKFLYKYYLLGLINAIMVALPYNYYGVPSDEIGPIYIRPYASGAMVIFSIYIYVRIAKLAYNVSKATEDPIARLGFKWIGHAQICFIIYFILILIDTIYFTITGGGGYSIFVYFAWFSAMGFFLFSYFGLIMPAFLKKKFTKSL